MYQRYRTLVMGVVVLVLAIAVDSWFGIVLGVVTIVAGAALASYIGRHQRGR